jgi:CheY-like chemotaxis protein
VTSVPHLRPARTPSLVPYVWLATYGGGEAISPSSHPLENPEREEIRRRRPQILIVDDEDGFRAALGAKLKRIYHATVLEAAGPHDALQIATMHPDLQLILLDIAMPVMDGTEVFRQMRAAGVTSRIVLMSAHDNAENRASADALGVRLLAKPMREEELRQILLECG